MILVMKKLRKQWVIMNWKKQMITLLIQAGSHCIKRSEHFAFRWHAVTEPPCTAKSATVGNMIDSGSALTVQNITESNSRHTNTHESKSRAGHPLTWDNTYVRN